MAVGPGRFQIRWIAAEVAERGLSSMHMPAKNAALSDVIAELEKQRDIYRLFATVSQCPRARMMYAKNHARAYKREKAVVAATAQ